MSGGGGSSRVPIPHNARKILQDIREITGKQHSDDEIYTVLKECSMDPNETAQKLLYLDTFHEVKRRRDRTKEGLSSRASEDSRSKQGGQGRGGRGASGGHPSNFPDGGGGRNPAVRRENGVNHIAERGHMPSTQSVALKTKNNAASQVTRVSATAPKSNVPENESNGSSGHGSAGQTIVNSVTSVSKSGSSVDDTSKQENTIPQASVAAASSPAETFGSVTRVDARKSISSSDSSASVPVVYSSSADPMLAPSMSQNPGTDVMTDREVGSQSIAGGPNHVKGSKTVLSEVSDLQASDNEKSGSLNLTSKPKTPNKSNDVEKNGLSETSQSSSSSYNDSVIRPSSSSAGQPPQVNASGVSTPEVRVQSSAESRQHVTFPNHFQVPEALKSGLTFGSFDSNFGLRESSSSGPDGGNDEPPALESSLRSDETATSSNQSVSTTAQGDLPDYPHSPYLIERTPPEGNAISGVDTKADQPQQEVLLAPEGPPIQTVQNTQNYGLNLMSAMLGTQQIQFESADSQAQETSRLPKFISANSQAMSSPSPTPPLQSSIPVSPQSVSIFRPPYPPNFFPYGHLYPPIYVSPVHQFLSHSSFPQQPSAGNMYLPAAAAGAAAGIKFPLPQFKAGTNTGNTTHIGIPSGSFISPPVGYAPSPTVNAGSSTANKDLGVSQLKENHIYTTAQLSEGSAVWMPAPGQDISNLHVNSMYNLTHQGQQLTFPPTQAGYGAFAGIYQPGQSMVSPSTLLQQSQAMAGNVETVGPASGAYQQQPQHGQINWKSNF
ncbi:hypothetical protein L6164_029536 [Bauhinia variegata]|uniref:Uncharacterized protein n=1 Tax=Bauhinia variegata TaxID=167791 RepID=A0ACB9L947_BAUVA|nr:hypothetical protein L6164_029536 [Bauhinia variegata]